MKYQKIINLLDNTPNQPTKFRTNNWVEINDDACGTYNTTSEIKIKTIVLKSSLSDYSDGYILIKRTIVKRTHSQQPQLKLQVITKKLIFKICAPFTDYISEINNTQVGNAKDIYVVMFMYNLIEQGNNYSKTSGSLRQCYRDKSITNNAGVFY